MTDAPGTFSVTAPVTADDTTTADAAYAQMRRGVTLLWQGDFHNGRQLLTAVGKRIDRQETKRSRTTPAPRDAAEAFTRQRDQRARRAGILGRLLVEVTVRDGEWTLDLRRAPEVAAACAHAWGPAGSARRVPLTELQGVLGAYQWHLRGVDVPVLGEKIYPDYGVFSPTRSEYVDLVDAVAAAHLAAGASVLEIGTGTGVLAAVLVRRGAGHVVATDVSPRAVACARTNLERLGAGEKADVMVADLWPAPTPDGPVRSDVVVFNPPWLPGSPTSELELGIYDEGSDALRRFLVGLGEHLTDRGEGWLVLSDFAEHLALRTRSELETWIQDAGLQVLGREDTVPRHPKVRDATDPLHVARAREVTSLWRLGRQ
ncbi:methyltransferase [Corynebacterium terpenotabidum]|uniref:Putative methyltransferase n=1 Tax=Corynebacterium terpenotabidum Y-11 TaxID=1200352 RepID=S4XAP0_9CORY|nr:methyltransferase [Corynebacterium terpenotabidum]AGP29696.1 putative methyltransferase [Corynebacterium terpenotabidum Y-11]